MAITIRVSDPGTGSTVALNDRQRDLVVVELTRVRRFSAPFPSDAPRIAADLTFEVDDNGSVRRYAVLSSTVLFDVERRRVAQFYMGLQLLEWLHSP